MAIRIDREHDHYIHITASFLATSFGRSLPALVRMKQPGRAFDSLVMVARVNETVDLISAPIRSIPRELWSMVDFLLKQGLSQPNLWREKESDVEMAKVREVLDVGGDLAGAKYALA